jgi:hypothetical protein
MGHRVIGVFFSLVAALGHTPKTAEVLDDSLESRFVSADEAGAHEVDIGTLAESWAVGAAWEGFSTESTADSKSAAGAIIDLCDPVKT